MIVLPTFRSSPDLVSGIPVFWAILLLSTSMPRALLSENDVPGNPKIFMSFLFLIYANVLSLDELVIRYDLRSDFPDS